MNGVGAVPNTKKIPLTIVNKTNKHFKFNKGNVVAVVERIDNEKELTELTINADNFEQAEVNTSSMSNDTLDEPITQENLTAEQNKQLKDLLDQNSDIFAKHDFDLGKTDLMHARIDTGNADPVRKKPYRIPFAYRSEVKDQIQEMIKAKLISPSNSEWAAPILCVPKKDGGVRICCDYRGLNQVIKKFYWPLPNAVSLP